MGQGSECFWGPSVDFPDPELEDAIRNTIEKPEGDICASDLLDLYSLSASYGSISNLSGVQYCVFLHHLNLYYNQISDISPLAGLSNLTYLSLGRNQITDVTPLAGLVNVGELSLAENQISDISSLAGLTELYDLRLNSNQISDISPLVENPGLSCVDPPSHCALVVIYDNPLSSTSCTVYVPELKSRGVTVISGCPQ